MATDLVTIATTAVLTQFLTPAAKNLGEVALERIKQVGSKAVGYLAAVGREAQPVEEKVLYPLLQAASLEANPALAEKWAVLLANAADPASQTTVQLSFVSIMRELTSHDALLLEGVSQAARKSNGADQTKVFIPASELRESMATIATNEFYVAIDNSIRLNLLVAIGIKRPDQGQPSLPFHDAFTAIGPGKENISLTHLGLAFLAAVTPPAS